MLNSEYSFKGRNVSNNFEIISMNNFSILAYKVNFDDYVS